jgi:biopolymer transport protein ExbD
VTRPRRLVARCVRPAALPAQAGINVTPLVDVVLVLLIIFMVVTPLREEALRLRVPAARAPAAAAAAPPPVVSVLPDGAFAVDGVPVPDASYEPRLAAALRPGAEGARAVVFVAADAAPYRRLVRALDGARRAGAEALVLGDDAPADAAAR